MFIGLEPHAFFSLLAETPEVAEDGQGNSVSSEDPANRYPSGCSRVS